MASGMTLNNTASRSEVAPAEPVPREVEVTLLFCDVVRSTELTRRLGDRRAYRVISGFHDTVLRASAPHGGEELELRGDGVLLAFEDAAKGLASAVEIQSRLLDAPAGRRVAVRIGLHTGPALRIESGYFGSHVILSSRIAEAAAPGEILASGALVTQLAGTRAETGRWVVLKGIPEPHLVFPISWRSNRTPLREPTCPSIAVEALLASIRGDRRSESTRRELSCMLNRRNAV
jgi:class 3 adenylate cyclase